MEESGRREFLLSKGWLQAVVLVVLFGFTVLGLLAYRTYQAKPPVPTRVTDPSGRTVYTGAQVAHGQKVFLNNQNSTIVFPLPLDMLEPFMKRSGLDG